VNELAGAALQAYEDGQAALAQGDWVAYGEAQQRLEDALRGLGEIVASPVATPVAKPAATPVPET
jgi:hypothetical protein